MSALVMLPIVAPSPWFAVLCAVPVLLIYAPTAVRRHRALIAGLMLATLFAVGIAAAEEDFAIARPKICDDLTWTDADYWYYGCYAF
jgi:hypothetical protein